MPSVKYNAGDHIFAKYGNSSKYYSAQVVSRHGAGDKYVVRYEDGTQDSVSAKNIAGESRMRSKSPARKSKSRSRSRGRSKSPSRAAKTKSKSSPSPSPSRKSSSSHKARSRPSTSPARQSARIAALELQKEDEKKDNAVIIQQKKETPRKRSASRGPQMKLMSKIKDVLLGPVLTMVGIAFLPVFFLAINAGCKKAKCTIQEIPRISTDYKTYWNPEVVGVFFAFLAVQAVISQVPLGRTLSVPTARGRKLKYRGNALFAALVSVLWFGIMACMDLPVTYAARHFTQFLGTAIAFGFVLSVLLYIKGRKASPSERYEPGNTGNIITDFVNGREVNPRVGTFHIKLFFTINVTLIMWLILDMSYLYDDYQKSGGKFNIPATIVVVSHLIYGLSYLAQEELTVTSVKEVYEGIGYMGCMVFLGFPFAHSLTARFLVQHPQNWNNWQLGAFVFMILVGYVIMWGALMQKAQFRKNPHDPALAHLDRIPTPNGKGLLVGGWWGVCRRPNYLGDLIMFWTWAAMCGCDYAMPYVIPVITTLLLIFRQLEDERDCKVKHGGAWDRYCQRVRSRLIPKIY